MATASEPTEAVEKIGEDVRSNRMATASEPTEAVEKIGEDVRSNRDLEFVSELYVRRALVRACVSDHSTSVSSRSIARNLRTWTTGSDGGDEWLPNESAGRVAMVMRAYV
jgi:hypothetical protein